MTTTCTGGSTWAEQGSPRLRPPVGLASPVRIELTEEQRTALRLVDLSYRFGSSAQGLD
jgi:hypothetical protein